MSNTATSEIATTELLIGDVQTREVFNVIHDKRKIRHGDLTRASTVKNVEHAVPLLKRANLIHERGASLVKSSRSYVVTSDGLSAYRRLHRWLK